MRLLKFNVCLIEILIDLCSDLFDHPGTIFYAVFMSFWGRCIHGLLLSRQILAWPAFDSSVLHQYCFVTIIMTDHNECVMYRVSFFTGPTPKSTANGKIPTKTLPEAQRTQGIESKT